MSFDPIAAVGGAGVEETRQQDGAELFPLSPSASCSRWLPSLAAGLG